MRMEDNTDITAHRLLQSIYRDEEVALPVRMRVAIECLPFENPKVSAVAISHMNGQDFATALERAIQRSKSPLALNAPAVIEHDPSEMKTPNQRYRRY